MEIFKTRLFIGDTNDGYEYCIDTICIEGTWWLVSSWLLSDAKQERIPERLVRLSGLQYQEVNEPTHRFFLNNSIPKSVLDGKPQAGYVVDYYPALADTRGPGTIQ